MSRARALLGIASALTLIGETPYDRAWADHSRYPSNRASAKKKARNRRRNRLARVARRRNRK